MSTYRTAHSKIGYGELLSSNIAVRFELTEYDNGPYTLIIHRDGIHTKVFHYLDDLEDMKGDIAVNELGLWDRDDIHRVYLAIDFLLEDIRDAQNG